MSNVVEALRRLVRNESIEQRDDRMLRENDVMCRYVVGNPVEKEHLILPKAPINVKRMSEEQKKALEKIGWETTYELTGQRFTALEVARGFSTGGRMSYLNFEALTSRHSEVAINFNTLFLDGGSESLEEQRKRIDEFSEELGIKVPGVKAVMGNAFDYAELACEFNIARGGEYEGPYPLFSPKSYLEGYARTETLLNGGEQTVVVSFYYAGQGLHISSFPAGRGNARVFLVPLVVPI